MTGLAAAELGLKLREVYERLLSFYGPQHWWPARTPFEVMVGAILTQSAAWVNVEKAIANLERAGVLSPAALRRIPLSELAVLVHPSGYYNAKALKLKALAQHLEGYGDSLERLFAQETAPLREELLSIHGVGEETADSIILYAAHQPIFVVDTYTRRILRRLGLVPAQDTYQAFQSLFMACLPHDEAIFNEYHALLVAHGKTTCRKTPLCERSPLRELCPYPARAVRHPEALEG